MREISERVARLDIGRQFNIARKYSQFGTVANAVRIKGAFKKRPLNGK